jgi:hypothetical protein
LDQLVLIESVRAADFDQLVSGLDDGGLRRSGVRDAYPAATSEFEDSIAA